MLSILLTIALGLGCRGGGGGSGVEIKPIPATDEQLSCEPDTYAYSLPGATLNDSNMGWSVAVVSASNGSFDENAFRWVAGGAPDADNDSGGAVRLIEADTSNGSMFTTSSRNQTLTAPTGLQQFGWAIAVADIRDCNQASPTDPFRACGHELIVGAPNNLAHSNAGRIAWYRAEGQTPTWLHTQTITPPGGTSSTAEFGSAIAVYAPRVTPDPWNPNPNEAHFVAVGAPGDSTQERVYIYKVDGASATPLTFLGHIAVPTVGSGSLIGKGFGTSLATGDFDGDGIGDLAVGAPLDNTFTPGGTVDGRVVVFRGNASPPYSSSVPFDTTNPLILPGWGSTATNDLFGSALAAGRIHGDEDSNGDFVPHDADGLVVGAPGVNSNDGGICDIRLGVDGSGHFFQDVRVYSNSPASGWGGSAYAGGRYGSALAVGNFLAQDEFGVDSSDAANQEEVAVGSPLAQVHSGVNGEGTVLVYLTDEFGPDYSTYAREIVDPLTSAPSPVLSHFGSALAPGYVQESPWADVAIGAPLSPDASSNEDGMMALTRAESTSAPTCVDVDGFWQVSDADSTNVDLKIFTVDGSTTVITFLDDFTWSFEDSSSDPCSFAQRDENGEVITDGAGDPVPQDAELTVPAGVALRLSTDYSCPGTCTPQTWTNEPLGDFIHVESRKSGGCGSRNSGGF